MILTPRLRRARELMWKCGPSRAHPQMVGPKGPSRCRLRDGLPHGGAYSYVIARADGQDNPFHGVLPRDRPERAPRLHCDPDDLPPRLVTTVTFADEGGKTKLTVAADHAAGRARPRPEPGLERNPRAPRRPADPRR